MRILALASYPERMAATRFRMAKYIPHLAGRGIDVHLVPWLDDGVAARLYEPGAIASKARGGAAGAIRQLRALIGSWDAVWIQREAMFLGPPIVEALAIARELPVVIDYDDAIWIPHGGPLKRAVKVTRKFDWMFRRATHAIAGSESLAARARGFGVPCTVLPTVVERGVWTPRSGSPPTRDGQPLTLGWVGTQSTAAQLGLVAPALRRLRAEGHHFRLVVVGAGSGFHLGDLDVETRPWALDREIDDFRSLDVGITPMFRSAWHEGKCAFKQIQLMAVGVPFVSSMVGGARDFLVDEENALIAESEEDWYRQVRRLLLDQELRRRLARAGRMLVEQRLCIEEQAAPLADAIRQAARGLTPR